MKCLHCTEGFYLELETGEDYCPDCGHYHIALVFLVRPTNLSDYNPTPKGGWSKDYRDDLPF